MVRERLGKQNDQIDAKVAEFAIEDSVQDRLNEKASKNDYGSLFKEIAEFRLSLWPLISKRHTLEKFIKQVNTQELNETNARDFNQKIEQLNFKIKEL